MVAFALAEDDEEPPAVAETVRCGMPDMVLVTRTMKINLSSYRNIIVFQASRPNKSWRINNTVLSFSHPAAASAFVCASLK